MLQDLNNRILNWLESVSVDSRSEKEDLSAIERPRKRAKLNNSRAHAHGIVAEESDKKRDRDRNATASRLPTPSASVSPTASRLKSLKPTTGPDTAITMPPANNKRPRGRPGPDDDVDSTISAKPIRSAPGFSQPPSLPASKTSKVSNNSSPTRQIRNAGLQPSGFITASFKHDPQPDSLKRLCSSLELIHAGFGILPKTLQESFIDEDNVFEWMFGDEPQFGQDQLPTIWAARQIWRMAARCDGPKKLPESAWNNDVHSRVLDWVLRDGSANNDFLDYRSCFNAAILPEYQPESSPTKMVDYCVCLQPDDSSLEYARIEQLCRQGRPGQSINHTDWGDLVSYPIGISIETKGPGITYETALVQVATWHAAQWRSIFHNRERHSVTETPGRIPFLPGIIVIKHDWYFVATDRDGMGKARTFEKKTLGSTESLLGIYKLMMALQKLAQWLVDEFWPAFQVDVLGLESDVR